MPKAKFHGTFLFSALAMALFVAQSHAATEKVLYAFNIADGESPGGLVFDSAGNLYGVAFYGGSTACGGGGCGVVFKLTPASNGDWTESTIYTFAGEADGSYPSSPLIFDKSGNLYGVTYGAYGSGGIGSGTAYRLSPNEDGSWSFHLLYTFGKKAGDGMQPYGPLVFDSAGNLYGATFTGGNLDVGTVFELSSELNGTWQETTLHSFIGGKDGSYPSSGVTLENGNVFVATESGGIGCHYSYGNGCGVIAEFSPNEDGGWKESFPRRFTGSTIDGESPYALTFDTVGNLYGSAIGGTADYCDGGCGLVYRMSEKPNGVWTFTALHNFNGGDGEGPDVLLFGASGSVYSEAGGGGVGMGLVFELNPAANWSETVLYEFNGAADGGQPSSLIYDGVGNLYGTTTFGGNGVGVVFEVTP
jgi:hypothetical protein